MRDSESQIDSQDDAGIGDLILYRSPEVIVYTMGKVGSVSISSSLAAKRLKCFDIHNLAPKRLLQFLDKGLQQPDQIFVPPHVLASTAVLNTLMRRRRTGEVTKIITSIREPVSRNISAVFQNLPVSLKDNPEEIDRRVREYNVSIPDNWFTQDFEPVTGLNVLDVQHDREQGSFRFSNDLFDVLLMKVEIPDTAKAAAISNFLGVEIEIRKANEAKDKWYNETYRHYTRNARAIPNNFVERCLGQKYFRSFYSDAEIANTVSKYAL